MRAAITHMGIEALPDRTYGDGYRCAATLVDGTILPCVIVRNATPLIDLAERRIAEESRGGGVFGNRANPKRAILQTFVAKGNCIDIFDISHIEPSPFAILLRLLNQLRGETAMSLTAFVLESTDGRYFSYATRFRTEFFDLPEGVSFSELIAVHNHSVVNADGGLVSVHHGNRDRPQLFDEIQKSCRERPFFECFIEETL